MLSAAMGKLPIQACRCGSSRTPVFWGQPRRSFTRGRVVFYSLAPKGKISCNAWIQATGKRIVEQGAVETGGCISPGVQLTKLAIVVGRDQVFRVADRNRGPKRGPRSKFQG